MITDIVLEHIRFSYTWCFYLSFHRPCYVTRIFDGFHAQKPCNSRIDAIRNNDQFRLQHSFIGTYRKCTFTSNHIQSFYPCADINTGLTHLLCIIVVKLLTVQEIWHPPVITLGARNRLGSANVVASADELAAEQVAVVETGRGGDVTYHGPGQLVGYPIFDLKPDRCDVHQYVRDIEEALIVAMRTFGVAGMRVSGLSGVWVGADGREEKLAAIGVRISRWITSHGFALNVSTNLHHFELIVPCGIADRGVTSLEKLLGTAPAMTTVEDAVVAGFSAVFGTEGKMATSPSGRG